jgi:hypothetical protein
MAYQALVRMGMEDKLFEAVVLRYPDVFSAEAVVKARDRLSGLSSIDESE